MKSLKTTVFTILFATGFGLISCSNSHSANTTQKEANSKVETTTQTEPTKKKDEIDFENAFIVDVRTPGEFNGGHWEGAINIPLNELQNHLDQFEGKEQIVVYCRSGARSGNAKRILERAGYSNVINGINLGQMNKIKKSQEN